jgi:crotonobetainyl-CoA:carnitine CoA-transferase CaiB-like acyl-CoA transferase
MPTVLPAKSNALSHIRICDFTGQLAGAGATRWLAAFGAQVIRIEDPVNQGKWDILRGTEPFKDERRGIEFGGGFQNHNVEKRGITLNLRTDRGKQLLRELVAISDAVTENFAAGVLERWGFDYDALKEIKHDIVYVSNCGFGHTGPYRSFRTWGPIVQAACGLTFSSGLPGLPPAGWGYSYMDHHGGNIMAIAILCALVHRQRTGEGQWVDMSCTEAGASLLGPAVLDYTVNGRPLRRTGMPNSNRSQCPPMAPHGIYACDGDDDWIAISCRDDHDWSRAAPILGEHVVDDERYATTTARLVHEDELDLAIDAATRKWNKFDLAARLQAVGVPAAAVQKPAERIDADANTAAWGLWPTVQHREMGEVRVDGEPVHMSETDWVIARGSPCLGEHNEQVYGELLGLSSAEIDELRADGVI